MTALLDNPYRELIAKAIYESWQNIPACSASKSWEDTCQNHPPLANSFRRHADRVLSAMIADYCERVTTEIHREARELLLERPKRFPRSE